MKDQVFEYRRGSIPAEATRAPARVTLGYDQVHIGDHGVEYYGKYDAYHWDVKGETIVARCYEEATDEVLVLASRGRLHNDEDFQPIVFYLMNQYRRIYSTEKSDLDRNDPSIELAYREKTK